MTERKLGYPETRAVSRTDDYHGVTVEDPYRWLEDLDSEETRAWIEAQNKLTFSYLEEVPAREKLRHRFTRLWDYERFGLPFRRGGRTFYSHNDGLQNQNVLYVMESLDAAPEVLLDPNTLSPDGTVALVDFSVSEDGRLVAYALATSGSDWLEWRVLDVPARKELPDRVRWSKFSTASWTLDGLGFFYSRYDDPGDGSALKDVNYFQKLCYHRVGTPQSEDALVYERKDQKEWGFGGSVTEDGRYLIITAWKGTQPENALFYKDLQSPASEVVLLLGAWDARYTFLANDGPVFYASTDLHAPRGRVVAIDIRNPEIGAWREIVKEAEETLEVADIVGGRLVACYLKDARSEVRVFGLDGSLIRTVDLPGVGTAMGFHGRRKDRDTFYWFTSFTTPGAVYRYDLETGASTLFRRPALGFDPDAFETRQVFYRSKDGTRVPMFLVHRKGLALDGNNPVYLYGYGGFDVSLTPTFSVSPIVWMEMGGVYAQPNLRGGGEYGRAWHEAGMKTRRQNVFDDFLAAAEWLIDNGYTRKEKLAIGGGSNGGLLVGACMIQRPDLFAACLPAVGVLDMLRFHKFTIGWAWVSDYGSPENPEEFKALLAYSPYHNLKEGAAYPATLVLTGDHDDRVFPAHSFKFAARLQACQGGDAPVLIRIETRAGHGMGKPTAKLIEEAADRWAFLARVLSIEVPP